MWDSIWINAHLATLRLGKYGGIRRAALGAPLAAIFAAIAFAMLVYGLFTGLAVLRSKRPTER